MLRLRTALGIVFLSNRGGWPKSDRAISGESA
jgi:hypothetical protein